MFVLTEKSLYRIMTKNTLLVKWTRKEVRENAKVVF